MGVTRRRSYTYTLSHFYNKTTGITQGTLREPSLTPLRGSTRRFKDHKGCSYTKRPPEAHKGSLEVNTHVALRLQHTHKQSYLDFLVSSD